MSCRIDDLGMIGQTEVIVCTEIQHLSTVRRSDMGALRRTDLSFRLVKTLVGN
jgi:hypothetical protein